MRNSRRIILWLVPLALCTLDSQSSTSSAGEAALPASDAAPGTASLKPSEPHKTQAIPWDQIGSKAGADYPGDGLAVVLSPEGARLHCVFQRLEGEATTSGLWLTSAVTNQPNDRFQVKAARLGRVAATSPLPETGTVSVTGQTVRFARAGLVEEYAVSLDGVRQDFVVTAKPAGGGEMEVRLTVAGARVEATTYGAQLVLEKSSRKIAYSRLRATDANGKELPAWIEALPDVAAARESAADKTTSDGGALPRRRYAELAVIVSDAGAVYPVRIDPTFSDANWISMGGVAGTDGWVSAAVTDGSGNLYIGGQFTVAGDVIANDVAKWNGSSWSTLGSGMNAAVESLAVSGNTLYAGGYFTMAGGVSANSIAQWNGNSWSSLGLGMSGPNPFVSALAVLGNTVYAGGYFTTAGSVATANIAQWNGNSWSALGLGIGGEYPDVIALAVSGNNLYVGGTFTTAGGVAATNIAQWDGSSWSALGSGMSAGVTALAVSGNNLYAGGAFTTAGGVSATNVAQWNGSSWSALGLGLGTNSTVHALAVSGNDLYVGGTITTAGGSMVNQIAQWNGSSWSALGSGLTGGYPYGPCVYALAVSGGSLYAGGDFTAAGGLAAMNLAQWSGESWSVLGSGIGGGYGAVFPSVLALAVSGNTLYAGGNFTSVDGAAANFIAQWNGSSWSALGSGMNSNVLALALLGTNLYAGGTFTTAGGVPANVIAEWNGSSWSALGSGVSGGYPGSVESLLVSGTNLYVGGSFLTAGGNAANHIAQWNGSSWSALGSGIPGGIYACDVYALAVLGNTLYAGGDRGIYEYNGGSWSALGSEVDGGSVYALAVSGNTLYAGGNFTSAGGVAATNLAQWNGTSWLPLGSGMASAPFYGNPQVYALAVSGTNLYAGGHFTAAGGVAATNLAQWNGTSWSALGSGTGGNNYLDPQVNALAVAGNMLCAGGCFSTAGEKICGSIAEAIFAWPTIQGGPFPNANGSVTLNLATGTNCQSRLYATTNLNPPVVWQPVCTNCSGGAWQFVDTNTAACKNKYYRVSTP